MSTIKSSAEHLTLNADGASKDIKFQANGVEKASISSSGAFTSTTIDATALTGDLPAISGANLTGVGVTGITSAADATAITIDSSEQVGIGTSSPDSSLEIYKASTAELMIGSDNGGTAQISLYESDSTTKEATIKYDGLANNLVIGTSGEANAIVIPRDSGNVGIGVTPENWNSGATAMQFGSTAAFFGTATNTHMAENYYYAPTGDNYINTSAASNYKQKDGTHVFQVATSGTADSAITWKTPFKVGHQSVTGGDWCTILNQSIEPNGTVYYMNFLLDGSSKGTILGNSTSVSYNTSSDYRLKENVDYTWDATTRLKQLKPARFNFISDDTNTLVDGFIAHEVSSVVPEAINGVKDAMTDVVLYVEGDELPEGKVVGDVKTAATIDPQGIDQSKLVPLLVKTIQELEARITALEA
jgi:hypothetical protein